MNNQIVTKKERDALAKMIQEPSSLYELTPNGMQFSQGKYELQRWRARRMHYIDRRLAVASHVLNRDFDRSR